MYLKNPTNDTVEITVDGIDYSIAPQGTSVQLSEKVAEKWLETHEFLMRADAAVSTSPATKTPAVEYDEVSPVVEEQEKPVKKVAKK